MAVVSMLRMRLLAHDSEKNKIMRVLTRSGACEITEAELPEGLSRPKISTETFEEKTAKLEFGIYFLKEMQKQYTPEKGVEFKKLNFKKENKLYEIESYEEAVQNEDGIFSDIEKMRAILNKYVDLKTEIQRCAAEKARLSPYKNIDMPLDAWKASARAAAVIGVVPKEKAEALSAEEVPGYVFTFPTEGDTAVVAVALKEDIAEVTDKLNEYEFSPAPMNLSVAPAERIRELDETAEKAAAERTALVAEGMEYACDLESMKLLYDYYSMAGERADAEELCAGSVSAFILEGWVPVANREMLEKALSECSEYLFCTFRAPKDDEIPPTKLKNDKFTSAFEEIVAMFGVPGYRERDPSVFVAIFYFLFFGIMISDAGYGLLLAIGCFLFLKIKKPVKTSGRMIAMFGFCGIATVVWGALFGGWFSITLPEDSFLNKLKWFNPMDEPLKMFLLAIAAGAVQMAVGFAIKGVDEIKSGNALHGILSQFGWVLIFIGLGLLFPTLTIFLGAVKVPETPEWVSVMADIAMYVALVGFAMMVIGGMVGKKNVIKALGGAFGSVYGSINVASDLLSYSSLFGLGLTTGVIGYVVNMLADLIVNTFFGGGWYGWIVAVPVLIIGHAFNMSINLLGAYVHDSRLQYVEFFGRFYEGQGHAFKPLGSRLKYTYLNN